MNINWLAKKVPDWNLIQKLMEPCIDKNQYTNVGPLIPVIEQFIRKNFKISDSKAVIVTNSGTSALHACVAGMSMHKNKQLHFTTQAYSFPSSVQGPLVGTTIVDIDAFGGLDLSKVGECDGLIVTNVMGNLTNLHKYENYCKANNKILVYDNAATSYSFYDGINSCNYGNAAIISFHHTKPFGFGEGGCIIVDDIFEHEIRCAINFGIDNSLCDMAKHHALGSNYRMSDINAAFILSYLQNNMEHIVSHHQNIYDLFVSTDIDGFMMFPNFSDKSPVCSSICLLADKPINIESWPFARKYYKPLVRDGSFPVSEDFYSRIICIPCNIDITYCQYENILNAISYLLTPCSINSALAMSLLSNNIKPYLNNSVSILGGGGHAKASIDIFTKINYAINNIYDNKYQTDNINFYAGHYVSGTISGLNVSNNYGNLFCAIGDNATRKNIVERFNKSTFVNCIHPAAIISPTAIIGKGNYIGPCAVISSDVVIGDFNIINDGCFIGHDTKMGNYNHICPNASLGGEVNIGNEVLVGTGASVIPKMTIENNSIIGAGAVVVKHIKEHSVVMGVPAK